jgi:hypothetical protein
MSEPKYAVLKWEDWVGLKDWILNGTVPDDWPRTEEGTFHPPSGKFLIKDAEVIRKQDITSAPIFHAYSSIIMSYVEVLLSLGAEADPETMKRIEGLQEIADHFHRAAVDAELWPTKKLPT